MHVTPAWTLILASVIGLALATDYDIVSPLTARATSPRRSSSEKFWAHYHDDDLWDEGDPLLARDADYNYNPNASSHLLARDLEEPALLSTRSPTPDTSTSTLSTPQLSKRSRTYQRQKTSPAAPLPPYEAPAPSAPLMRTQSGKSKALALQMRALQKRALQKRALKMRALLDEDDGGFESWLGRRQIAFNRQKTSPAAPLPPLPPPIPSAPLQRTKSSSKSRLGR